MNRAALNKFPTLFIFGLLFLSFFGAPDSSASDDVVVRTDAMNITVSISDFMSAFGTAATPAVPDAAVEDLVLPIPAMEITIDPQGGVSAGTSEQSAWRFSQSGQNGAMTLRIPKVSTSADGSTLGVPDIDISMDIPAMSVSEPADGGLSLLIPSQVLSFRMAGGSWFFGTPQDEVTIRMPDQVFTMDIPYTALSFPSDSSIPVPAMSATINVAAQEWRFFTSAGNMDLNILPFTMTLNVPKTNLSLVESTGDMKKYRVPRQTLTLKVPSLDLMIEVSGQTATMTLFPTNVPVYVDAHNITISTSGLSEGMTQQEKTAAGPTGGD